LSDRLARRSLYVSNFRGLAFVIFAGAAGFTMFGHAGRLGAVLSLVGIISFIVLVVSHARIIDEQEREERWVRVNLDAAKRVKPGAWYELPQTGEQFRDAKHPYADDLDVFGVGSLFQRVCVAQTQIGYTRLSEWFNSETLSSDFEHRQRAVRALAPQLEFRQELEVLGLGTRDFSAKGKALGEPGDLAPFLAWAAGYSADGAHRKFFSIAWALPTVSLVGALLSYRGLLPVSLAILPLAFHLIALVRARPHMRSLLRMLSTAERMVNKASPLLELLERNSDLAGLQQQLNVDAVPPSFALAALSRIGSWFELRHNGLVYPFANVLFLWDIHCWLRFENWRKRYGQRLRDWLAAIGEAEALSSLAGFFYDEPDCCFAEIADDESGFEAIDLGHALIHPLGRVRNDVAGLRRGQGLLVTGSNMSGKSTYLRAIGLGAVLGLAGGPVCAKRLRISRLRIATSMRISDNLAAGVSHFYAELQKLKRVLDATMQERPVLFLLDEILHGTNSRERQIGARFILAELLRAGALGAVSTHDSALCELRGELTERLKLVHFRESVTHDEMTFDYRLYPGPVTAGNALRLMQKLGILVPLEDG
jgi:hypothetical protein